MAEQKKPFMYDIHVHPHLPYLGSFFGRSIHGIDLKQDPGFFVLAFYDIPFPSKKAGLNRLVRSIETFVKQNLDHIHTGRGKAQRRFAISIESARLVTSPALVEKLYQLGVRFIQPLHFLNNKYGHSCGEGILPVSSKGLTDSGLELLHEMKRFGMVLDLAHMNRKSMEDSLKHFSGPIVCSHTGLMSHKKNERNIHDEMAQEIFRRGGLVGVIPWRALHSRPHWTHLQWQNRYVEVIDSLLRLGGEKGICVGSDRGAPLWIPRWFYRHSGIDGLETLFQSKGFDPKLFNQFLVGNAHQFLSQHIGPSGLPVA